MPETPQEDASEQSRAEQPEDPFTKVDTLLAEYAAFIGHDPDNRPEARPPRIPLRRGSN